MQVHKCMCFFNFYNEPEPRSVMGAADMVFIEGEPHLVFTWKDQEPDLTVPLDPKYLQQSSFAGCSYLYQRPLQHPSEAKNTQN